MRFLIVGSGGLGGYFGARLHEGGHEVVFAARGANREALIGTGLVVRSGAEVVRIESPILHRTPSAGGPVHAVVVCTKMNALADVYDTARAHVGPDTVVLCLQNGVEAEDILAAQFGEDAVIGASARISATLVEPGVVEHTSGDFHRITLGERRGGVSDRVRTLANALTVRGIDVEICNDIAADIWGKFCFMAAFSAVACFHRAALGEVFADTEKTSHFRGLIDEVVALAQARGIALSNDVTEQTLAMLRNLPESVKPSTLVDLEQGRSLEIEWLSGAVVRLASESGVAVPLHQAVYSLLKPVSDGRR